MEKTLNEKEEQGFLWRTEHGLDIKFLFASNGGRKIWWRNPFCCEKVGQWRGIWRLDSIIFNRKKDELSYLPEFVYDRSGRLERINVSKNYDTREINIGEFGYDFLNQESLEIIADKEKKESKNVQIPLYNIPTGYPFFRKLNSSTYLYDSLSISDVPWGYEKSGHFILDPQENKFISTSKFTKEHNTPPSLVIAQPNLSIFLIELNRVITLNFYNELKKQGYHVENMQMEDINSKDIDLSELVSWFEEEKKYYERLNNVENANDDLVSKEDIAKAAKEKEIPQSAIAEVSGELKNAEPKKVKNNYEGADRDD